MSATTPHAEALTGDNEVATPLAQPDNARLAGFLDALRGHPWPGWATFAARLALLERLLQQHFDRLPNARFTFRREERTDI